VPGYVDSAYEACGALGLEIWDSIWGLHLEIWNEETINLEKWMHWNQPMKNHIINVKYSQI